MRANILSAITTIVVCLAGVLLYDRLAAYTYPATVTVPMLLTHYVNKSAFGIILVHLIRKKYAWMKYFGYALLFSIAGALIESLIGFPASKELPKHMGFHDFALTMASMIIFTIFSRPSPPARQDA